MDLAPFDGAWCPACGGVIEHLKEFFPKLVCQECGRHFVPCTEHPDTLRVRTKDCPKCRDQAMDRTEWFQELMGRPRLREEA